MISRHCGYTLDIILRNLLALVEAGQGSSKHVHSVVDQSSLRLEYVSFGKDHNNKISTVTLMKGTGLADTLDGNLFSPRTHDLTTLRTRGL